MLTLQSSKTVYPLHEAIVRAITRRNPSPTVSEVLFLLGLITELEIINGHDDIIRAIKLYFNFPGGEKYSYNYSRAIDHLRRQQGAI